MKNIIKKIILWAFRDRVVLLQYQKHIGYIDKVEPYFTKNLEYLGHEIVTKIVEKMIEDNLVVFTREPNFDWSGETLRAEVIVIK